MSVYGLESPRTILLCMCQNHNTVEPRSTRFPNRKKTLIANRHKFNLRSLGPLGESRAGIREAVRRAERGISLPVAGAPTLPSESDVENDVTFGGRVSCDETVVAISEKCRKKLYNAWSDFMMTMAGDC